MTQIAFQDGKVILRDGKVGTGEECCCGGGECCPDGETCGGSYTYRLDPCVQVDGQWVRFDNVDTPCECCNGFDSTILFEDFEPAIGENIRIIECARNWCGEAASGIPDYCCCDDLTPEQSTFCSEWWLRLSGDLPSDLVDPDAICAKDAAPPNPVFIGLGCCNPLP